MEGKCQHFHKFMSTDYDLIGFQILNFRTECWENDKNPCPCDGDIKQCTMCVNKNEGKN